jgi:hypothetical protein
MKECTFSETQFSFCFTFEYIRSYYPYIPLPLFPNTVLEGRDGGGFDVEIMGNLFFQFKIPKLYDKLNNALRKQWDVFGHEFYRIKVETDKEQYRLLKLLVKPYNKVYYTTPDFHDMLSLNRFYQSASITKNSSWFPLDSMPAHSSGHHHLVYSPKHGWGKLFSEPIDIIRQQVINPLELFQNTNFRENGNVTTLRSTANELLQIINQFQENTPDILIANADELTVFQRVSYLLLSAYNIHWYPIYRPI